MVDIDDFVDSFGGLFGQPVRKRKFKIHRRGSVGMMRKWKRGSRRSRVRRIFSQFK